MHRLDRELQADLDQLDRTAMRRRLRPLPAAGPYVEHAGRRLVNLASNDYLGLSQHPRLKQAAIDAIQALGTGATASRLVTGHLDLHEQTERAFAAFKHTPAALLLPTGYMANLAALTALAGPGDLICLDKLNHASLIDAARATGAQVRSFPHLNYTKLQRLLANSEIRNQKSEIARPPRRFIVTDAIFSMDGDAADLPALCDLADRYDAIVLVDEAHATGLLGDTGAGLCEAQGVADRVHAVVSTASKGLGSLGGIVTASQPIIDTLINRARSLIYTTAVPPAQAAAIQAALEVIRDEPWRRQRVLAMSKQLRAALLEDGWALTPPPQPQIQNPKSDIRNAATPIIPLIVHTAERALHLADHLQNAGFLAVAIRPPTVPPNTARVRLSLRADLADDDLAQLRAALAAWSAPRA